jgi:hypothetical protein
VYHFSLVADKKQMVGTSFSTELTTPPTAHQKNENAFAIRLHPPAIVSGVLSLVIVFSFGLTRPIALTYTLTIDGSAPTNKLLFELYATW